MPGHGARIAPAVTRLKLVATAVAASILAVLMTVLTLQTMREARDVEEQARQSHERMRNLWALEDAAKRLQNLTYRASRFDGAGPDKAVAEAQREFNRFLQQVLTLPQHNVHQSKVAVRLEKQAGDIVSLLRQAPEIARRLESLWRNAGYKAALAELTDLSVPYDTFFRTINEELAAEGMLFADATQRSADRQGLVRTLALAMLVFGLLMAVTLLFVLLKRLTLQKANFALAADDERRRAFLVDASHELRIPVTIIRGEAQVALRQETGARSETVEALERILEQTRSATRMLDDLFLIARAEAGGLRMNLQRIDAGVLAKQTACDFSTLACESGATVVCHKEPDLPVIADADRLRQALAALIDNALRHTREGVIVVVGAKSDGDDVVISVSDDGPGIDPDIAAELFQRFRRGRTRSEGSGLGLTVVRALAEAFGGTVRIEAPTSGARICLRLPLATSAVEQNGSQGDAHELTVAG
jgi:signal transduction histidine kinase